MIGANGWLGQAFFWFSLDISFLIFHKKVGQSHQSHQPIPHLLLYQSPGFVFSTDSSLSAINCQSIKRTDNPIISVSLSVIILEVKFKRYIFSKRRFSNFIRYPCVNNCQPEMGTLTANLNIYRINRLSFKISSRSFAPYCLSTHQG